MGHSSAAVTRVEAAASAGDAMLKSGCGRPSRARFQPKGRGVAHPSLVRPDIADGLGGDLKLRRQLCGHRGARIGSGYSMMQNTLVRGSFILACA